MATKNPLPDGVPEVASIHISVGMDTGGVGSGFSIDGMSNEEALGRLISIQKAIEVQISRKWEDILDGTGESFEDDDDYDEVIMVCPHCDTEVTLGDLEREDNE